MTSLVEQLQRLALPESSSAFTGKLTRPSLLFDSNIAATYDKDTFYALGINGFQELCTMEPIFHSLYYEKLFSEVAKDLERTVQTKPFNKKLDSVIDSFLLHVSPYFLLRPVQKCLEWLLYRFRIQMFNVDGLMRCVLPYYGTNLFTRVVQLLDIKQSSKHWQWICDAQTSGAPFTRVMMMSQCAKNSSLLQFICKSLSMAVKIDAASKGQGSFRATLNLFTSTVLGVVQSKDGVAESMLINIMPTVIKGISSRSVDYQASSFMIISQLSAKVVFEGDVLHSIIDKSMKHCLPSLEKEAVLMVALLCQTQEKLKKLHKRSFRRMTLLEKFYPTLLELSDSDRVNNFLTLYFDNLVPLAFHSTDTNSSDSDDTGGRTAISYANLLKSFIEDTSISRMFQHLLLRLLVAQFNTHCQDEGYEMPDTFKHVCIRMQQKYPESFDFAVSQFVENKTISSDMLNKFLNISLSSAKHQVLPDSNVTLSLALLHADSFIRCQALLNLGNQLSKSDISDETKNFARENIQRIIQFDTESTVVSAALQLLMDHFSVFVDNSAILCQRIIDVIFLKWSDSTWNSTVKLCLKFITSDKLPFKDISSESTENELCHDKIVTAIMHIFAKSLIATESSHIRELIQVIVDSELFKENLLLSKIAPTLSAAPEKDQRISNFVDNFVNAVEKNKLQNDLIKLIDAITIQYADDLNYDPVVYLLLLVGARIQNHDHEMLLKLSSGLINLTKCMLALIKTSKTHPVIVEGSSTQLMCYLFEDLGGIDKFDVSYCLVCHIWKELILKLPRVASESENNDSARFSLTSSHISENSDEITSTTASVFGLMFDMLSVVPGSNDTAMMLLTETLQTYFDVMFDQACNLMRFLCKIWLSELHREWKGAKMSTTTCVRTLQTTHALLESIKGHQATVKSSLILEPSNAIVPSIMLACSSSQRDVRLVAIRLLQTISTLKSCPLVRLAAHLGHHSEEIALDSEYCSHLLGQYFHYQNTSPKANPKDVKQRNELMKGFMSHHVIPPHDGAVSSISVLFYEQCLSEVKNIVELETLFPYVNAAFDRCKSHKDAIEKDGCQFASLFLHKLSISISHERKFEDLFVKALSVDDGCFTAADDKLLIPQSVALDIVTNKFFALLSETTRQELVNLLITINATASNLDVPAATAKVFKAITLHSNHIINLLQTWGILSKDTAAVQTTFMAAKRARKTTTDDTDNSDVEKQWKRAIVLLELLHHKKRIKQPQNLVGPLFDLLNNVIDGKYELESQEYVTLLILGCLLNLFNRTKNFDKAVADQIRGNVKVELLVKCIHSTEDTQTHQQALLLLAEAVLICPEKVLHSVMSVFTFMGSNLLRRDDSYSFQVISRTMQTVIPPLLNLKSTQDPVLGIIRVFIDAIPHIPAHRRLVVFEELFSTVGAEAYLWKAMVLLVDQQVSKGSSMDEDSSRAIESSMVLWVDLCRMFDATLQVHTITKMMQYLRTYIDAEEDQTRSKQCHLIDLKKRTTNQLRRFRVIMLALSTQLLGQFKSMNAAELSEKAENDSITANIQCLLEHSLLYLDHVMTQGTNQVMEDDIALRYHKTLLRKVDEFLEKINGILPFAIFLSVVNHLISNRFSAPDSYQQANLKLVQLFNHRLNHANLQTADAENEIMFQLSQRFLGLLTEGCKSPSSDQNLLRAAALAIAHITKLCSTSYIEQFVAILPILCDLIKDFKITDHVLSAMIACIGELCTNLKAHCIVHLAKIAKCLIGLLSKRQKTKDDSALLSILMTTNKLFNFLGHFLSPYLDDFLSTLSIISYLKSSNVTEVEEIPAPGAKKLKKQTNSSSSSSAHIASSVLLSIANKVSPRVLIPAFTKCHDEVSKAYPLAASAILQVVSQHMGKLDKTQLSQHAPALMNLYLHCMEFRTLHPEMCARDIDSVEDIALSGVISLLLKLPEALFKPLYMKLQDWGSSSDEPSTRVTTFYKCTDMMAARLKGLFEIFAVDLIDCIAKDLQAGPGHSLLASDRVEQDYMLRSCHMLDTLAKTLQYSSNSFLTQGKFDKLLHPIIDQLEKNVACQSLLDDYVIGHVVPCMGQLAATSRSNLTWQPLNYHLLMKTRNSSPKVRCYALEALQAVAGKFGDDYLVLLPETIPFLAELMEDESDEVEKCCQRVTRNLEEILGEPLQKYF